jgi:hypothetical protein
MNKQIRQLAEQAYLYQEHDTFLIAALENFAELIVKECIGITDDLMNRNADGTWTSNELYTDYNGALSEVKRRIEEHFGVEE